MSNFISLNLSQAHYLPEILPTQFGTKTTAYWTFAEPKAAVIFVHGFHGSPDSTWNNFPVLLTAEPKARESDLFFYGYNAATNQANASALEFHDFLSELLISPTSMFSKTLPTQSRATTGQYSRVLIVAHSLGAVVARRALLWADQNAAPWLPTVEMVLFAPAHHGAYAAVLASSYLTGGIDWWLGKVAAHAALYKMPLVQDLTPGSLVLQSLESDTAAALAKTPAGISPPGFLAARRVVWALEERVVINNPYGRDQAPKQYPGKDHISVCKPDTGFREPLDLLLGLL